MKILSLFCAVLLLPVLFFAGCGKAPSSGAAQASSTARESVTISYYYALHPSNTEEHFADDSPGLTQLREKTGVTIKWQLTPGANTQLVTEAFNLLMASGDIPDVVCGDPNTMLKLYPQAWLTVDTIVKANPQRYPNLNKYIFENDYLMKYMPDADGHVRYIPMLATRRIGSLLITRQDLLTKYGLKDPVTLDDWHTALTRAKQDGKIPYMTRSQRAGILTGLLDGYLDSVKEDYFEEDGKIKYGVLDPRLKEGIEIARKWYAEGLIDPEYPSTQTTRWWEAVTRGDVFCTFDNIQRLPAANLEFMNANASYRMTGIPPMLSPRTGKQRTTNHYPTVRDRSSAISINAKNPERILDMFEYCYSDEGFILMNFGVENISFTYVDGVPRLDPDFAQKVTDGIIKHPTTTVDMPKRQKDELYYDYNTDREDHVSLRAARDVFANGDFIRENWIQSLSFTDEERAALNPILADINTYRSEMLDKFIMGIEPMSNWDAFVARIQKMNLQTTIDIYQKALDRLLKK
ncbi:MAG: extracellular solute-binding protein [Treponema sp.]|jgi:putative aldouronate transport system substrate-binding protein|nr:extracellular solute-binding protein [Treponema sp.]